ncbi:OmpA family protein [Limnohabitans sp. DCL3]|uniref:OmpA family protein n=1 Tax=Limnohabitans sp. DCL3 TaxID=3374103 RepID=UPI003A892208
MKPFPVSYSILQKLMFFVLPLTFGCAMAEPLSRLKASDVVEIGNSPLDAQSVAEGLFPEDACEQLKTAGFKCMGFRPAVRYSLPTTSFRLGSATLPDGLKSQLEVFAEVLRNKRGNNKLVRIEGHADASGSAEANLALSQRRAEEVKRFLVERGADPAMLRPEGHGASTLRNSQDPTSQENRRVEIGRADLQE